MTNSLTLRPVAPSELEIRCAQAGLDPSRYFVHTGDYVRVLLHDHISAVLGTVLHITEIDSAWMYVIAVSDVAVRGDIDEPHPGDVLTVPINGWPKRHQDGYAFWDSVTLVR